jgi:hypothetical protein
MWITRRITLRWITRRITRRITSDHFGSLSEKGFDFNWIT